MSNEKIIQFPKMKLNCPPQSPQEIEEKLIEYKENYSREIADILWQNVLGEMARSGCNFDENVDKYFPSMVLILEAIKSLHLLTNGIDHPLQEFAKENITIEEIYTKTVDIDEDLD